MNGLRPRGYARGLTARERRGHLSGRGLDALPDGRLRRPPEQLRPFGGGRRRGWVRWRRSGEGEAGGQGNEEQTKLHSGEEVYG
ncbi:MAG: hypothetical protein ACK55I_26040, partial [bacterium]